jgi:hypothetical protein
LRITLLTSKTSQDASKEFLISRHDAPRLCSKVEEWIAIAGISPGTPVLRPIVGKGVAKRVGAGRLSDRSLRNIVKRRVQLWLIRPGPIDAKRAQKANWSDPAMRTRLTGAYAIVGDDDEKAARILGVSPGSARLAKKRYLDNGTIGRHQKAS